MPKFVYGTTYCRSCGHNVALDSLICPNCGNKLPGNWDLQGIKSAGLLILLVGLAVVGLFPLLPVLLGLVVGLGIPLGIAYLILKANGVTLGQKQSGNAPYYCLKCGGDMYAPVGVCPKCNHGADQMQCPCGTEVTQPHSGAFETVGVTCPNCGTVLRR